MRIALRIAGVLARSNPYGIMKGNDGTNSFDVLAREENQNAGNAEIYPWHSGPGRWQEQPDGTEQGLNGISEPQILGQNL